MPHPGSNKIHERSYLECLIPDLNQFTLRTTHVSDVWVGHYLLALKFPSVSKCKTAFVVETDPDQRREKWPPTRGGGEIRNSNI
jgi:hypothetical protein